MGARPLHVVSTARQVALDGLAEGHSRNGAAALAGVSDQTLRNWMRADNDYLDAVEAAEREALAKVEAVFLAGAMRDPRLALAYLERREASWKRGRAEAGWPVDEAEQGRVLALALQQLTLAELLSVRPAQEAPSWGVQ